MKAPFRFEIIRALCAHLSEEEMIQAEGRFGEYLDVVAQIIERDSAVQCDGDNRFDKSGRAPHDSSPPTKGV